MTAQKASPSRANVSRGVTVTLIALAALSPGCKRTPHSATKESLPYPQTGDQSFTLKALRNTALVGEKSRACDVKAGATILVQSIASAPAELQGLPGGLPQAEFGFVEMKNELASLFASSESVYEMGSNDRPTVCSLKRVVVIKSDFEVVDSSPLPTPSPDPSSTASPTPDPTATVPQGTQVGAGQGVVVALSASLFKQMDADSSTLTASQMCAIKAGQEVTFKLLAAGKLDHLHVALLKELPSSAQGSYCAMGSDGYLYFPNFSKTSFKLTSVRQTAFKSEPVDSGGLASSKKCVFNGSVDLTILALENVPQLGLHIRGTLAQNVSTTDTSVFCQKGTQGYLFYDHFKAAQ